MIQGLSHSLQTHNISDQELNVSSMPNSWDDPKYHQIFPKAMWEGAVPTLARNHWQSQF